MTHDMLYDMTCCQKLWSLSCCMLWCSPDLVDDLPTSEELRHGPSGRIGYVQDIPNIKPLEIA